ncbi:MAG: LPS export ABC transporter periplasmic protein LptC [Rhodospirillaceae bacterium]|nr:LPS export ABC transporter periplasmic protein LptC [Rhodospirillaceae bacterium]|tara:strand:- start:2708 stop:3274 length:567 start_codon:yes stop_codon:yes gene_type:complete
MKLLFPAAAIAIIGLTFAWPQLMPDKGQFRIGDVSIPNVDVDGLVIENPRYFGVDNNKRSYQLSAMRAIQKHKSDDLIFLRRPKADLFLRDSTWVAVNSKGGVYHKSSEIINLSGGVQVYYDKGYEFKTESMKLDFRTRTAIGDDVVSVQGPAGQIDAEGFQILEQGAKIIFTGKSKAILKAPRKPRP